VLFGKDFLLPLPVGKDRFPRDLLDRGKRFDPGKEE
jgi:hypothetical protein